YTRQPSITYAPVSMRATGTIAVLLLCATHAFAQPSEPPDADAQASVELGRGVDFTSADGSESINLRARLQLRFTQFSEEDGDAPEVTEFQARRIRLLLQGFVRSGMFKYYLQLGFSNRDT